MKKLFAIAFICLLSWSSKGQDKSINGTYDGHIALPGMKLAISVHLNEDDRKLSGSIDIPEQKAKGLALTNVKFMKGEVYFCIADVPGNACFSGKWKMEVDSLTGTFNQNGGSFPMRMKKASTESLETSKKELQLKLNKIQAYTDSVMKKGHVAGLSMGIIQDGKIIFNRGFGYSDIENKISCNETTLFAIGSCTKAFTTALLSILNDEQKFDWEKPVKQYVHEFSLKDNFAAEQANAIDICSHRTGLPRHDLIWYSSSLKRNELIGKINAMEFNKPFRTTWQYNNFMFLTAGVIAERIAGQSWEDLVQKKIFDPLEMKQSKIHFTDFTAADNKSKGYDYEDKKFNVKPYRNIDEMGPAGSIFSTSTDMLNWIQLLLNKGEFNGKKIISSEQIDWLTSPKMVMPASDPMLKNPSYGLGWMNFIYNGKTIVSHGGNIDGFSAYVIMVPEEKIGMVILSNKNSSSIPELLGLYATDVLLGNPEFDWFENKLAALIKARDEKKPEEKKPKKNETKKAGLHPLNKYAGEYTNNAYGSFSIAFKDGGLVGKFNSLNLSFEHFQFETFLAKFEGEEDEIKVTFFTNENGKIDWFQIKLDAAIEPIQFKKLPPKHKEDANYIAKILGTYDVGEIKLSIEKDGSKLMAKTTDGQSYEIDVIAEDTFGLKGIDGYSVEFVFDTKQNCNACILHQPNGDFDCKKIK